MKNLLVSPITRAIGTKKMQQAALKSVLYQLAIKDVVRVGTTASVPVQRLHESLPIAPGYGHVFPWPDDFVRYILDKHAEAIVEYFDDVIVNHIVNNNEGLSNVLLYKKCLTEKDITDAVRKIYINSDWDSNTPTTFHDPTGDYRICATSADRLDTLVKSRNWEYEMEYMDHIDRPLYGEKEGKSVEYGRLKISDGLYVVFLNVVAPESMESILFGPGGITVTPVEKNLRATFYRTPAGEQGRQPRGVDVGWYMEFGAKADPNGCVVLKAQKAVSK